MTVEAIEDSIVDDALISATIDMFLATMAGIETETGKPIDMWPTVEAYPTGDHPTALAMWAVADVVAGYTTVFIASSKRRFSDLDPSFSIFPYLQIHNTMWMVVLTPS